MKKAVKVIFHIDMNAFFTSVEQIVRPELKGKPIAISGSNTIYNKGVILTASYEARQFGVKSAMPVFQAKELCPELILVPARHDVYQAYSDQMIKFLKTYTPLVEVGSIDEAYLDVSDLLQHPLELAKEIQSRLYHELGLPCSIGIAPNKFLAKMASDLKKPMGITVLRRREVPEKLWPLSISQMYGIGKKTAPKLINAGVLTIGDLIKPEHKTVLEQILGNQYEKFYQHALGYGDTQVDPRKNEEYKSIGHSTTMNVAIVDEIEAKKVLHELTEMVCARLIRHRYLAKTITTQIRYENFKTHSKSLTIAKPTDEFDTIYPIVESLFEDLWSEEPIRLLGVSTGNLVDRKDYQEEINLFNYEKQIEAEKLIKTIHAIKRKYGENVITRGYKLKK